MHTSQIQSSILISGKIKKKGALVTTCIIIVLKPNKLLADPTVPLYGSIHVYILVIDT